MLEQFVLEKFKKSPNSPRDGVFSPETVTISSNHVHNALIQGKYSGMDVEEGVFPDQFKKAFIRPLLLKIYCPVSNLSFISKILEKVVASRLHCNQIQEITLH